MSSVSARTGRHRQRYDNHYRLVSGCIPYKLIKDDESGLENRIRILMISTTKRDNLVFPKGGWEDDETVREAACREALEEAGIRGNLKEKMLGVWEFLSKSSEERDRSGVQGGCRGYMFAMEVTQELETQEQDGIGSSGTPAGALFGTRTPAAFPQQEVRVMALAHTN
ncbi:NUDIX hydrolase domain [Dillenia turbinata]|uniref:NUDIX hydrolase domain n=1 Tax=Dillenia turbinata TaxID=194707 RepID=A0AAN8VBN9_9MAGN